MYANAEATAAPPSSNASARSGPGIPTQGSKSQPASASATRPRNPSPAPPRFTEPPAAVVSGSLSYLGGAAAGALLGLGYGSDNDSDDDEEDPKTKAVDAESPPTFSDAISHGLAAAVGGKGTASVRQVSTTAGAGAGGLASAGALVVGSGGNSVVGQGFATGKGPFPDASPATLSGVSGNGSGAATSAVMGQQAEGPQVRGLCRQTLISLFVSH